MDFRKKNLDEITVIKDEKTYESIKALITINKDVEDRIKLIKPNKKLMNISKDELLTTEYKLGFLFHNIINNRRQGRYLGTLNSIYSLIEAEITEPSEKEMYWNIISEQLTIYEKVYLTYILFGSYRDDNLRQHIHDAKLLEETSYLPIPKLVREFYSNKYNTSFNSTKRNKFTPFTPKENTRIKTLIKDTDPSFFQEITCKLEARER